MSGDDAGARAAAELFARAFGGAPTVIAAAPGRVNLIGEHTDYNGGEVLPIAIVQRTRVVARANGGATVRVLSASGSEAGEFPLEGARPDGKWWDYIAGTAARLAEHGLALAGADLAVWSDLPAGAGLGSSASLEIAAGLALARVAGHDAGRRELALAARRAEEEYVGVAVGIMDQFASALASAGHALRIWCDSGETEQVPFAEHVLIFDTGVPRALRTGAFNARRAECEGALAVLRRRHPSVRALAMATAEQLADTPLVPPLDRRARHVVSETRRVDAAAAALARGEAFPGALLLASHASLRDDFECSAPELDWFVEHAMREPGVRGARMVGAGWGGCAIALGAREALEEAARRVASDYAVRLRRTPRWWISGAEAGASVASIADS